MLILAVGLSALALGISGAALTLGILALVVRPRGGAVVPAGDPEEEKKAAQADEKLMEGISSLMDYDPFRPKGGEGA